MKYVLSIFLVLTTSAAQADLVKIGEFLVREAPALEAAAKEASDNARNTPIYADDFYTCLAVVAAAGLTYLCTPKDDKWTSAASFDWETSIMGDPDLVLRSHKWNPHFGFVWTENGRETFFDYWIREQWNRKRLGIYVESPTVPSTPPWNVQNTTNGSSSASPSQHPYKSFVENNWEQLTFRGRRPPTLHTDGSVSLSYFIENQARYFIRLVFDPASSGDGNRIWLQNIPNLKEYFRKQGKPVPELELPPFEIDPVVSAETYVRMRAKGKAALYTLDDLNDLQDIDHQTAKKLREIKLGAQMVVELTGIPSLAIIRLHIFHYAATWVHDTTIPDGQLDNYADKVFVRGVLPLLDANMRNDLLQWLSLPLQIARFGEISLFQKLKNVLTHAPSQADLQTYLGKEARETRKGYRKNALDVLVPNSAYDDFSCYIALRGRLQYRQMQTGLWHEIRGKSDIKKFYEELEGPLFRTTEWHLTKFRSFLLDPDHYETEGTWYQTEDSQVVARGKFRRFMFQPPGDQIVVTNEEITEEWRNERFPLQTSR